MAQQSVLTFQVGWLILVLIPVLVFAGVLLLWRGLRRRRRGDTPHCAACGYNLTGLTSEKCPECGSVITPTSTVHCVVYRRPVLAIVGVVFLVLGLTASTGVVRNIKWYQLKPTS